MYFSPNSRKIIKIEPIPDCISFCIPTTAADHFQDLLQIATPEPFLFCGDVSEDMKQAVLSVGLDATFVLRFFGFNR